ncbi:MAG: hypothetical protein IT162_22130, partial [Bryobacterales bacterium]|nr:hypothetical protein [Bryobacterales bacterium]
MRRNLAATSLLALTAAALPASAQYYYSDSFAWWNSGAWSKNGSPQFGGAGLSNNDVYDDSLIAWNNGGNAARQEIRVTFAAYAAFGSGWNAATVYLNANVMGSTGYLLAFRSYAAGTLTVDAYDLANGWAAIGSAGFSYNPAVPTVVRAIKTATGIRIILGSQAGWISTSSNWTGAQGVGFLGGGNGPITMAELAPGDVTAPGAVGAVATWTNGKDVDLQWTAATDNGGGSGVFQYRIYRNGVFIGTSRGLTYTDAAVTANASYTYTVTAEDFHGNEGAGVAKAVTNTPNNISQIGVRPLGSYWGGGGENIDMRSGNVNYTMG